MNKVWKEITNEYPDIEVVKYDYDMDAEIVKELKVGDILPVTIFYNNGEEVTRLIGEKNKQTIIDTINKL